MTDEKEFVRFLWQSSGGASAAKAVLSPLPKAALPNPNFVAKAKARRRLIATMSAWSGVVLSILMLSKWGF
jgi:hypothetical protein